MLEESGKAVIGRTPERQEGPGTDDLELGPERRGVLKESRVNPRATKRTEGRRDSQEVPKPPLSSGMANPSALSCLIVSLTWANSSESSQMSAQSRSPIR